MRETPGVVEALNAWVREIIIILFLAGSLEMLLPETEMKRYARVAVGFFVVLAVGQPIFALMGEGLRLDRSLIGLAAWDTGGLSSGPASAGVRGGTEWQELSRDRALAAARAALERQLSDLATRDPEVAEARVEVDLETDPSSAAYGHLLAVRVMVRMAGPAADGGGGLDAGGGDGGGGADTGGGLGSPGSGGGREGGVGSGLPAGPAAGVEPVRVTVQPVIVASGRGSGGVPSPAAWPGGPAAVDSGGAGGTAGPGPAAALAARLRSVFVLLLGVPPGGITVEVWPPGP